MEEKENEKGENVIVKAETMVKRGVEKGANISK